MASRNRIRQYLLELIKHPLALLIFGSILGSIVIPEINLRTERLRQLQQNKQQKAIEILRHKSLVNGKFDQILTRFESFHKDNKAKSLSKDELRIEQKELTEKIYSLYENFNEVAWWHSDLYSEIEVLRLADENDLPEIKKLLEKIEHNLKLSTSILDKFWFACLNEDYTPDSRAIDTLMINTRNELSQQEDKQSILIKRLCDLITK